MPGEDGYALLRKVRARELGGAGAIPAVALTAHTGVEDRIRALTAGYQMYLPKPVEPAELVAVVASLGGRGESSGRAAGAPAGSRKNDSPPTIVPGGGWISPTRAR